MKKKIANVVVLILCTYPVGIVIGAVLIFLWLVRALKIKGWVRNFPHFRRRVVVVCNHPYKGEQFLLIGLFLFQYILWPWNGPYTLADVVNYHSNPSVLWLFKKQTRIVANLKNFGRSLVSWLGRPRLIAVYRTDKKKGAEGAAASVEVLEHGGSIIMFPQGTRNAKVLPELLLKSPMKGKIMGPFKTGYARLIGRTPGTATVPVWFEFNSWHDIRITIGQPIIFMPRTSPEDITRRMQEILQELADKT